MTTITIDTPLKLKKTHFTDPLEAGYMLIGLSLKKQSAPKKSSFALAMEDYKNGVDIYNEEDFNSLMKARGVIN